MNQLQHSSIDWEKHFYYDETSPSCLRWNRDSFCGRGYGVVNALKDDIVGSVHPKGYWEVQLYGITYRVHRVIFELINKCRLSSNEKIDHINGNSLDNRVVNLRKVTNAVNTRNGRKRSSNTSGVTGVCWHSRDSAWQAVWVDLEGKQRSKYFKSAKFGYEEAFRLACEYRKKMIEELNAQGAGYTERHGT